ncbi:hypothetical protein OP10G_4734 [Fimbriimonas ginsengisoli Gsoil 348]|uniref:Uncharacterized protein n=1 Tax=Fimbriimonas ginsengisoli Gsoil 348 TaxID=661478 RepID=A0A068NXP6_FIMGI|nr:hypothetical protein OP10G_4734 [Fimbriimonas ginsengisoli Gsoil 348]
MPAIASNPVLVLVQPGAYDPIVEPNTFVHPYWVRWPASFLPDNGNRLLSLASGLDWQGDPADASFEEVHGQVAWRSRNYSVFQDRGHFRAQRDFLPGISHALLLNLTGGTRRDGLVLALDPQASTIHGYRLADRWPAGKTMVLAGAGDDLQAVKKRATDRILVVEYPPRVGQSWSRFWLEGPGWPSGVVTDPSLGIPGLVRASQISLLLSQPEKFPWRPAPDGWPGANRWLAFLSTARPWILGFVGLFGAILAVAGGYLVSQEKRSPLMAAALRGLALAPGALLLGGGLTKVAGLNGGYVWIGVAWLALAGLAALIDARNGSAHWLGPAVATLAASLLVDPTYSIFGPLAQTGPVAVSGELLGAALASFTLIASAVSRRRHGDTVAFSLAGFLAGFGVLAAAWWVRDGWILTVWWTIAAAVGLGRIPGRAWLAAGLLTPGVADLFLRGVSFSPNGLLASYRDWHRLNLYEHLRFVVSPAVLGSLFLLAVGAVFGSGFFAHQLRSAWRERPEIHALATVAGACAVGGLTYPPLLHAALITLFAAAIVTFDWLLRPIATL